MTTTRVSTRLTAGDTTFYQFDRQLGFWGVPSLEHMVSFADQWDGAPVLVRQNAEGNRDVEVELATGDKNIVCFGGSHTWGVGVDQTKRYSECLAPLTGRKVFNLGHCSLGLDQVCLAMLQKVKKYCPEIIVVEQYPWSVHRVLSPYVNGFVRPFFYLDGQRNLKLQKVSYFAKYKVGRQVIGSFYAFRKEYQEFKAGLNIRVGYDPLIDPIFLFWKIKHYDYMYNLIDKILVVMRDYCRQYKIKLIFGLGAIKQNFGTKSLSGLVDYDLPRVRLIELLKKNKISYVDMVEPLLDAHSEQSPVIFDDGHINSAGHRIFAQVLYEEFQAKGWVS